MHTNFLETTLHYTITKQTFCLVIAFCDLRLSDECINIYTMLDIANCASVLSENNINYSTYN